MGKIRFGFALLIGKLAEWALRVLAGRGSNTPGIMMLKLCPDALARFQMPPTVICVTGTNGKTSTSNLVTHILRTAGKTVVNNSKGSNMAPGLVTALAANCTLGGRVKSDAAVLEVDERSSQYIYRYFTPDYLLCTNLFRDSIKRNGHSEFIFDKINDFLPAKTTLLLNGNDMISGLLGDGKNERVFYSVEKTSRSTAECPNTVCDITACPRCHHKLSYEFYHYHHIGAAHCLSCGFAMPQSRYYASDVDYDAGTFCFHDGEDTVTLPFAAGNLFNVFNGTAAAAVCRLAGISLQDVARGVDDLSAQTGRFEDIRAGELSVVTMLFKNQNPISGSQSLAYLDHISGRKDVVLIVTDSKDKVHGHEDISWLYDTDFASLTAQDVGTVYIGGTRCSDLALRLILAGVDEKKLRLYPDYEELARELPETVCTCGTVAIYFELYAMPIAAKLKNILVSHFSEKEGAAQ